MHLAFKKFRYSRNIGMSGLEKKKEGPREAPAGRCATFSSENSLDHIDVVPFNRVVSPTFQDLFGLNPGDHDHYPDLVLQWSGHPRSPYYPGWVRNLG